MKLFIPFSLLTVLLVTSALAGTCVEDHFCFDQKAQQQPRIKLTDAVKEATGGDTFLVAHPKPTHHDINEACKDGSLKGYICKGFKD